MDVIFDFGNVLVRFDPLYMTRQYIADEDSARMASEVLFDRLYWDKLDAGELRDEEVKRLACARLPEELRDSAGKAILNWYKNLPDIPGMREIVRDCKARGDRLFLLSNISLDFAEKWRESENVRTLLEMFDGLAFSSVIGRLKPRPEAFRYIVETYGVEKTRALFIDDNAGNIEGAEKAGLPALRFTGDADAVRKVLGI